MQGAQLATRLNQRLLPGVWFKAVSAGRGARRQDGVRLVLTDVRQFRPATTAEHVLAAIRALHPDGLRFSAPANGRYRFDLVWGTDAVRKGILRGDSADRTVAGWNKDLERFLEIRQRYLIYPRGNSRNER